LRNFIGWYHRLLTWLMVGSVAVLIVPVSIQVISRYTALIPAWIWTQELSRFLFIWMIMLGSMIAVREGTHFVVDVWPRMGPRATAALQIVCNVFVLAFALVFVWWGIQFVRFGWSQTSELADLPMPFIFVAWPIAGITWTLFLAESFVDCLRALTGKSAR
jgi:TRAP-type C4-dicarboxylate transport system permease small subunit